MVVYIKTPHERAIEHITQREENDDAMQQNPEKAREIVERFARAIEVPHSDERVVEISGEVPFAEQYKMVQAFLCKQ